MDTFIIELYKDYLNNGISKKDLIALIGLDAYNNINPSNYF